MCPINYNSPQNVKHWAASTIIIEKKPISDRFFVLLYECIKVELNFIIHAIYFGNKSKAQVAYEIDTAKTFERETSSLVKASEALHCDHLTLVALTSSRDITIDGKTIHVVSALEWFLKHS